MRWFRFLLIAGVLATALLALWPQVRTRVPLALAGFWRNQILYAPEDAVPGMLQELTALGDDGLPVLVELIGCQRAAISRHARILLTREVDRWLKMPPDEAATHMAVAAKALAAHVADFGPSGREYAEDLVDRFMAASVDGRPLLSAGALPDCEFVLQMLAEDHRRKFAQRDPAGADAERGLPPFVDAPDPEEKAAENRTEPDPADNHVSMRAAAEANSAEPIRVLSEIPQASAIPPEPLDLEEDPLREMPDMPSTRPHVEFKPTRLEQPIEPKPRAGGGAWSADEEDARITAWMHQLHSPDKVSVHHAETHLAEAGFGKSQLELARLLTSPDPMVREQLAEILPQVPGIEAKTWLIWLSRDARSDVRLAAFSVMATINDPLTLKRMREMARSDPDHRIQEQGQRLIGSGTMHH